MKNFYFGLVFVFNLGLLESAIAGEFHAYFTQKSCTQSSSRVISEKLVISGGVPPYKPSLLQGSASFDSSNRLYIDPTFTGEIRVSVADSADSITEASIEVNPKISISLERLVLDPEKPTQITISGGVAPYVVESKGIEVTESGANKSYYLLKPLDLSLGFGQRVLSIQDQTGMKQEFYFDVFLKRKSLEFIPFGSALHSDEKEQLIGINFYPADMVIQRTNEDTYIAVVGISMRRDGFYALSRTKGIIPFYKQEDETTISDSVRDIDFSFSPKISMRIFGENGQERLKLEYAWPKGMAIPKIEHFLALPDGGYLVTGTAIQESGEFQYFMLRLDLHGTPIREFGSDGWLIQNTGIVIDKTISKSLITSFMSFDLNFENTFITHKPTKGIIRRVIVHHDGIYAHLDLGDMWMYSSKITAEIWANLKPYRIIEFDSTSGEKRSELLLAGNKIADFGIRNNRLILLNKYGREYISESHKEHSPTLEFLELDGIFIKSASLINWMHKIFDSMSSKASSFSNSAAVAYLHAFGRFRSANDVSALEVEGDGEFLITSPRSTLSDSEIHKYRDFSGSYQRGEWNWKWEEDVKKHVGHTKPSRIWKFHVPLRWRQNSQNEYLIEDSVNEKSLQCFSRDGFDLIKVAEIKKNEFILLTLTGLQKCDYTLRY